MVLLERIRTFLDTLDERTWYKYMAIAMSCLLALVLLVIFWYFRAVGKRQRVIAEINDDREQVREIVTRAQRADKQRQEITELLNEDPDFKIKGYLQEVMMRIGIAKNITTENDTQIDHEGDDYSESRATYQFTGTTMKDLTQLLEDIEQNKRLFTKELEITKSKKTPKTIDVTLTVATMQPKNV